MSGIQRLYASLPIGDCPTWLFLNLKLRVDDKMIDNQLMM